MDMVEMRDIPGPAEQMPPSSTWWSSDFIEKFGSVSLVSKRETLITREPDNYTEHDSLSSQTASQILWSTGMLSEQIPNVMVLAGAVFPSSIAGMPIAPFAGSKEFASAAAPRMSDSTSLAIFVGTCGTVGFNALFCLSNFCNFFEVKRRG
ncbi:hypothetical protein RHGRI_029560 [Rhododendron griersonianum]|uniref:Uncharacterized protein n=1 Tax=Rhododendron griersonianum TaxID=479676 RepID=A0AAV6IJU5_9ERIC|nr:hypothetical protein RHGRI_029560 [Rhododendron griersonianum]